MSQAPSYVLTSNKLLLCVLPWNSSKKGEESGSKSFFSLPITTRKRLLRQNWFCRLRRNGISQVSEVAQHSAPNFCLISGGDSFQRLSLLSHHNSVVTGNKSFPFSTPTCSIQCHASPSLPSSFFLGGGSGPILC